MNTDLVEYNTATEIATVYQDATTKIRELSTALGEQLGRLNTLFQKTNAYWRDFDVRLRYEQDDYDPKEPINIDRLLTELDRHAWRVLIGKLELEKVMSSSQVDEMRDALYSKGNRRYSGKSGAPPALPPITAENIISTLSGFIQDAPNMLMEKIREEFKFWRPWQADRIAHKTNKPNVDRLTRKVIKSYMVRTGPTSSGWQPQYDREKHIIALDSIFHALDGKGILKGHYGPLSEAIRTSGPVGETEYFRFKCFHNSNLHLEFKRLDLLGLFNRVAGGENLGTDFRRSEGGEMTVHNGRDVA